MAAKTKPSTEVVEPTKVETAEETHLSRAQKQALARYEREIAKAAEAMERGPIAIGEALSSIREQKLYKESYPTFDAYLEDRWTFGRAYASRMIAAAQTAQRLLPVGNIDPKGMTETQLRELRKAPTDEQQGILEKLAELDERVTAQVIKGLVQRVLPTPESNGQPTEAAEPEQADMSELDVEAFTQEESTESVVARAEQMASNLVSSNPSFARALYEALGKALASDDVAF